MRVFVVHEDERVTMDVDEDEVVGDVKERIEEYDLIQK